MKVLFLVGEEFEDMDFFYPYYRIKEEGHTPVVARKQVGKVTVNHGYSTDADISFEELDPAKYG
jgi:protease I